MMDPSGRWGVWLAQGLPSLSPPLNSIEQRVLSCLKNSLHEVHRLECRE